MSAQLERDSIAEPTQTIAELRDEINGLRKQMSLMQRQADDNKAAGIARYQALARRVSRLEHPIPGPAGDDDPLDERYDGGKE